MNNFQRNILIKRLQVLSTNSTINRQPAQPCIFDVCLPNPSTVKGKQNKLEADEHQKTGAKAGS